MAVAHCTFPRRWQVLWPPIVANYACQSAKFFANYGIEGCDAEQSNTTNASGLV